MSDTQRKHLYQTRRDLENAIKALPEMDAYDAPDASIIASSNGAAWRLERDETSGTGLVSLVPMGVRDGILQPVGNPVWTTLGNMVRVLTPEMVEGARALEAARQAKDVTP